ncbi:hypothetical protein EC9_40190 [Rosistilla ulvae]|uniref:Carboxypeptidase regulatory-like domain-containing protein n=1 Tax=Rosistilla ulvae TaxID=1930277 RepID=A0A517M4M4_9BACT|nr:carboxypeptidase-like regulatory domain-containing protein [Rosistilla ulvae]QDS89818.1 hypothetical protein EC9_40190 [Rosistilla ulvae]
MSVVCRCFQIQYALLIVVSSLAVIGCGGSGGRDLPKLGQVTGTVTLDGQPLADAVVSFQSKEAGRVASGGTDTDGNYTIYLLNDIEGAPVGTNQVMIVTAKPGDDSIPGSAKPETLPAKYNAETELTADVQPGDNEFNFDLTSN